jgi:hypothetical protein
LAGAAGAEGAGISKNFSENAENNVTPYPDTGADTIHPTEQLSLSKGNITARPVW